MTMIHGRWLILASIFVALSGCGVDEETNEKGRISDVVTWATADEIARGDVVPHSYIVAFKNQLARGGLYYSSYYAEAQSHFLHLAEAIGGGGDIKDMDFLTAFDMNGQSSTEWQPDFGGPKGLQFEWSRSEPEPAAASIMRVSFRDGESARTKLTEWAKEGRIWYAEPNYQSRMDGVLPTFTDYATKYGEYNDYAPWLTQINVIEAYKAMDEKRSPTSEAPLIAVMDSGIDYQHTALVERIWKNNDHVNQADCSNDIYGCNTTQVNRGKLGNGDVHPAGSPGPGQECYAKGNKEYVGQCHHGTHVAGIIAAEPQDAFGGVCPTCQIMTIKIVGRNAAGEGKPDTILDSSIIAGLTYLSRFTVAGNVDVRVVNASFGKFQRSRTVEQLIRLLRNNRRGTMVIAAAGNEDTIKRQYPGAFDDVVAVANVNADNGAKHQSSNYGRWVDIAAPGSRLNNESCAGATDSRDSVGILSTIPGGTFGCSTGTSMSAPIVTGVAGLILVTDPAIGYDALRRRLIKTANPSFYGVDPNQEYYPRPDGSKYAVPMLGAGIVNAKNAVTAEFQQGQPVNEGLNRVNSECGVVGRSGASESTRWLLALLLSLPLAFVASSRRRGRMT